MGGNALSPNTHEADSRPSLALELAGFKTAVRTVVRAYVPEEYKSLFLQPPFQADKRLRNIGIGVHTLSGDSRHLRLLER